MLLNNKKYKLNDSCEIENNESDDEYILVFDEKILVLNETAGCILKCLNNKDYIGILDIYNQLKKYFNISKSEIKDISNILDDFVEIGVVILE